MNNSVIGKLDLPEEVCSYLQRVFYELEGYKALLVTVIEADSGEVPTTTYQTLKQEYMEKFAEFNLIISEIKGLFLSEHPEFEENSGSIMVEADFVKSTAKFLYQGGHSCKMNLE